MHGLGSLVKCQMQIIDLLTTWLEAQLETLVELRGVVYYLVQGLIEIDHLTR